ncbi:MAG: sigma-70 family RNA polymerase sigma factor [Candidatus Brocadiia bacterium]
MTGDQELMQRAGDGDMDAFEELVRRHQQSAVSIAYHFLGDATQAEDVAQEAFLKILDAADRYEPTAAFRTYLHNVIWHLCVDIYRKKAPRTLDGLPAREDDRRGPEQVALADERSAAVEEAVRQLPSRQRMAVLLQHFEGMSYEEIAEALDCSASAVDSLLVRARRNLRDRLKGLL